MHYPVTRAKYFLSSKFPRFSPLLMLRCLVLALVLIQAGFSLASCTPALTAVDAQNANLPVSSSLPQEVEQTVHTFMDAMLKKDWQSMWSLLHPDARLSWQDEHDFVHFEQAKFGAVHLSSYTPGTGSIQHDWRNPDTTNIYPFAAVLSVSLDATAPNDVLSVPSAQALAHGLFHNTLFALTQNKGVWRVLVAGPADLEAPVLVPATVPAVAQTVPILMYHHVSHLPTSNALDYSLTVTTDDFAEQLDWLQQHGYHTITQTDLFDALYYGKALPAHPIMLTFDDGYEDVYTDALPLLLAHHYRAVFYIITGMIGGRYMTWPQVRDLASNGMQVSSHTVHHVNVGETPAWTSTHIELYQSKKTLEAELGQPVQFFCYPSGEPFHHDSYAERLKVLDELYNDGYVGATLDPIGLVPVHQHARTPYLLHRVRISGGESLAGYVWTLQTLMKI